MLYTQMPNQAIGHFTACTRKTQLGHCDNRKNLAPAARPNFEAATPRTAAAAPSAHMAGAGRDVETPAAVPASTSAVTECLPALRDPARSRSPQRHTCSPRSSSSIASTCLDSPSSPVADRPEEAVLSGPDGKCGIRVVLRPDRAATLVACCETTSLLQPRQVYVVRDGVALQGKLVAVRMHCLEVW
eukprot:s7129_g2.t1